MTSRNIVISTLCCEVHLVSALCTFRKLFGVHRMSTSGSEGGKRVSTHPKCDLNTPQLIRSVKNYPILWDPSHPNYHMILEREEAWKRISSLFWNTARKMSTPLL